MENDINNLSLSIKKMSKKTRSFHTSRVFNAHCLYTLYSRNTHSLKTEDKPQTHNRTNLFSP